MSNMNFMTNRGSQSRRRGVIFILLFAVLLSGSFSADAQVVVDDNGNVGIGTPNPTVKLHLDQIPSGGGVLFRGTLNNLGNTLDLRFGGAGLQAEAVVRAINETAGGTIGLAFLTASGNELAAEKMRIRNNGNVGIGTTNPEVKLHLDQIPSGGGVLFRGTLNNLGNTLDLRFGGAGLQAEAVVRAINETAGGTIGLAFLTASGNELAAEKMRIRNNGNVGIGTTSPASRLDVAGGCITGSMCSDARLKEDIQPLPEQESYLEKVLRLRGVSFQWKDRPQMGRQIGLIAQEVETVLPEAVTTPEGATAQKGLSCTALDAALIEAIKEQQTAIKAQQAEIHALRQDLAAIQRTQSLSLVSNSSH